MTDDARKANQERDGFVKTSCVAFAANYIALNRQVPLDEAMDRAMAASLLLWKKLQEWRASERDSL